MLLRFAAVAAEATRFVAGLPVVPLLPVHHQSQFSNNDTNKHTHKGSELRWTSPVSNMELTASGAGSPGLALLIHYSQMERNELAMREI